MPVTFFHTPGVLKRFQARRWAHRETFKTPANAVELFVATIVAALEPVAGGLITLGDVPSEPHALKSLLANAGISMPEGGTLRGLQDWSLSATGRAELKLVLLGAFTDAPEFVFTPDPARILLYSDHTRLTTLQSMSRIDLTRMSQKLCSKGFERLRL